MLFMQKVSQLFVALTLSAFALFAQAAGGTFVTVNGVAVPQSYADAFMAEQRAQGAPDTPEVKNAIREQIIRRELLLQEAKKSGVEKRADVAAQAEAARQAIYIRAYVQDYFKKNPMSDAVLKAEYDNIRKQVGDTEFKARHILVNSEDDAKAIIANLKKGVKFEELAKQSQDQGSKDNGGDLGWASPSNFVKPFADALTALPRGKYTEAPVKTNFGFHVILLEDTRPVEFPSFEEIKPRLAQQAQGQQIEKMLEGLRAKAKVQ